MTGSTSGLRIMHVCWLKPGVTSGYRTRVTEETRLLTGLGHTVTLAVFGPVDDVADPGAAELFANELRSQTGADAQVFSTSHFFDLPGSQSVHREVCDPLVRLATERACQIIHGQAIYAAGIAMRVAQRVPGLRTVFDVHGILPEESMMQGKPAKDVLAIEQLECDLLRNIDLAVLVSEKMGVHFRSKYGTRPKRQVLIPCCVNLDKSHLNQTDRYRERLNLGYQDNIVVGYAGTLAVWQWPVAMFNLFACIQRRLPAARLLLLIPQSDHATALDLLRSAGVPRDAYVLQEVPNAEVGRVLAAADVGLLLRQEHPVNLVSSPTKFGEYMAAGVPVLATGAVGDFSEWVEREHVGMLVPAAEDGLCEEALDRVCAFLEEVQRNRLTFALRCRELALERLDWRGRIQDLSRAYRDLLEAPDERDDSIIPAEADAPSGKTPPPLGRPLRILFNGHDLKFARGIIESFSARPNYEVRIDEWRGHDICDANQCERLLQWADIIFCEWCLGNARWYAQRKRPGQRLVVRLHHQEMKLPYRFELEWPNVDAILFINHQHYETFVCEQPQQREKAVVIFNAIDCSTLDQPKLPGAEFSLGFVGLNPMRKRPDMAVEILSRLRAVDPRYTLSFKTAMPWEYSWLWNRPEEREFYIRFFENIESGPHRNAVVFDPHGNNMADWYSKIGFILSTSDHEGSHQAVAEGMAAGCIPIIRNWDGATPLYPSRFVFSTVDEAAELIRNLGEPDAYDAAVSQAKAYARTHFDTPVILRQIEALFEGASLRDPRFPAVRLFPLYGGLETPSSLSCEEVR